MVVVGNEILSGKVQDTNAWFAARELRRVGVALKHIGVVPDEFKAIADEVGQCARAHDFVITSGGVGPTHDDITIEAIAQAFGRKLVIHPDLEKLLRAHFVEPLDPAMKMAEVPEGAVLNDSGDARFPTVQLENVYILPGIPQIFERKLIGAARAFRDRSLFHPGDLHERRRRHDCRAAQRLPQGLSGLDAGVVSAHRASRIPGEGDAGVERSRLPG